jgi:hypothetical protein
MNDYKFTVIIPVLYLTEYSRKALIGISKKADLYRQICFILPCTEKVHGNLTIIFYEHGIKDNVIILKTNLQNSNSNFLRYFGMTQAVTDYVYYQDCDDEVDYQTLLDKTNLCTGDNIVCFNINRRQYDEKGDLKDERHLYYKNDFSVKKIDKLMTNIVNKLIPQKHLKQVIFYNLPFSQDWCISYQLFLYAPHYYVSKVAYYYENNTQSTAGYKKTKYNSLLRVCAMKGIISRMYRACNRYNDALFLEYRYDVMLESRFYYLGKPYFPSYKWEQFNPVRFGIQEVIKHTYHFFISCRKIVNYYVSKNIQKNNS